MCEGLASEHPEVIFVYDVSEGSRLEKSLLALLPRCLNSLGTILLRPFL